LETDALPIELLAYKYLFPPVAKSFLPNLTPLLTLFPAHLVYRMLALLIAELLQLHLRRSFSAAYVCPVVPVAAFLAFHPDIFTFTLLGHKSPLSAIRVAVLSAESQFISTPHCPLKTTTLSFQDGEPFEPKWRALSNQSNYSLLSCQISQRQLSSISTYGVAQPLL
jgi:hypothetical protein